MPRRRRMPKLLAQEVTRMSLYKTITLEMLQQNPELYERLRSSKRLLPAMEAYAIELKDIHEEWKKLLSQARPGSDPSQISSEAMEMAMQELRDRLPSGSQPTEADPLSLDAAMSFIRSHSQPA
jgi:hypothetical protein